MTIERLYKTRKEAMQMLGFGRKLLDRAINAGEIPYIKLSEKKRGFLESDLIRYYNDLAHNRFVTVYAAICFFVTLQWHKNVTKIDGRVAA